MERFGKSSGGLLKHKDIFFSQNDSLLDKNKREAAIYSDQPARTHCVLCDQTLASADFSKFDIGYSICRSCGHLNGLHEDTEDFCRRLYTDDKGVEYGKLYQPKDIENYFARVTDIYEPKAEHLLSSLKQTEPRGIFKILEVGSGAGYFLTALEKAGADVEGHEVSNQLISFGEYCSPDIKIKKLDISKTAQLIAGTDRNVIVMIGVLEHLRNVRSILAAVRENKNIKYFYFSVPMFSLSVYLELCFPTVFNRHLGGGHTHLFTEKSIQKMCDLFDFAMVSQWWFGTDFVDLYRELAVRNKQNQISDFALNEFSNMMKPSIDDFQLILDRRKYSSEGHFLIYKK